MLLKRQNINRIVLKKKLLKATKIIKKKVAESDKYNSPGWNE
jgi:hypothetical protein